MITVVGSLNMDLVIKTDRIPRPGETVMGKNFKQVPGGKGGNQADAAAKLGEEVIMIGCVGNDSMGMILKNSLKSDGVNVDNVLIKNHVSTGIAAIIVESSGNNAITVAPGANYELNVEDIKTLSTKIKDSDVLLLQLETTLDTVKEVLKIAKKNNRVTILNPAPAAKLDQEIFQYVDLLTPNETELEVLTGHRTDTIKNTEIAGRILLNQGIKELVVTLGANGCLHVNKDGTNHYKAYQVNPVDTTAAGDSFNAALAVYLSRGKTMREAIEFAMKVGAMTVTKEGAQTSLPRMQDVECFDQWLSLQNKE